MTLSMPGALNHVIGHCHTLACTWLVKRHCLLRPGDPRRLGLFERIMKFDTPIAFAKGSLINSANSSRAL